MEELATDNGRMNDNDNPNDNADWFDGECGYYVAKRVQIDANMGKNALL